MTPSSVGVVSDAATPVVTSPAGWPIPTSDMVNVSPAEAGLPDVTRLPLPCVTIGAQPLVWVSPDATSQEFNTCMLSDRKSTRLNSSHLVISYAVFCLKK